MFGGNFLDGIMGPRAPIDSAEFQLVVEAAGFEVWDLYEFPENPCDPEDACDVCIFLDDATSLLFFAQGEAGYWFEFAEFHDTREAIHQFNHRQRNAEDFRQGASAHREVNLGNYSRFQQTSGGIYIHILRVDNVLIYVEALQEHRNEIREIMNQF